MEVGGVGGASDWRLISFYGFLVVHDRPKSWGLMSMLGQGNQLTWLCREF